MCKVRYEDFTKAFKAGPSYYRGYDRTCKKCRHEQRRLQNEDRRLRFRIQGKNAARKISYAKFGSATNYRCAVMNCEKQAEELHHVTYKDPLATVPLCRKHHQMNHTIVDTERRAKSRPMVTEEEMQQILSEVWAMPTQLAS